MTATATRRHHMVCELCDGHGRLPDWKAHVLDDRTGPHWYICAGCDGSGIVSTPCPEPGAARCRTYCYSG